MELARAPTLRQGAAWSAARAPSQFHGRTPSVLRAPSAPNEGSAPSGLTDWHMGSTMRRSGGSQAHRQLAGDHG
eukprot:11536942-Alexandrium_andersonii.AAC.1